MNLSILLAEGFLLKKLINTIQTLLVKVMVTVKEMAILEHNMHDGIEIKVKSWEISVRLGFLNNFIYSWAIFDDFNTLFLFALKQSHIWLKDHVAFRVHSSDAKLLLMIVLLLIRWTLSIHSILISWKLI